MNWKQVKIESGGRLLRIHTFTYMWKSATFHFEIDESQDGLFTGHGEHSTDKNFMIESVTSKTVEDCVSQLIAKVNQRL